MREKKIGGWLFCAIIAITMLTAGIVEAGLLHFKLEVADPEIEIGQTTTVSVSAWVDDAAATSGNGLIAWQVDMDVTDTSGGSGIVDITGLTLDSQVYDLSASAPVTLNNPDHGEAHVIQGYTIDLNNYDIGVGGFTEIFTFEVIGLAAGEAVYALGDFSGSGMLGLLEDGTQYAEYADDQIEGDAVFDENLSSNTIIVLPEPGSMMLLGLGVLGIFRRKKS